jgi:hypothetical protein
MNNPKTVGTNSKRIANFFGIQLKLAALGGALGLALVKLAQAQTSEQIEELKREAIQIIGERGPRLANYLLTHYQEKQEERLVWLTGLLIFVLPLAGFIGFILFPLFAQKLIKSRLPQVRMGQLYKLYFMQALVITVVLFCLGVLLSLLQAFVVLNLGTATNPQLVLEQQAINYIVNNRSDLVNTYTEFFVYFARDLTVNSDTIVISNLLDTYQFFRTDPLMGFAAGVIRFFWPLFSNYFLITFAIIVIFFLRRLWPDIKLMLRYPIDALATATGPGYYPGYYRPNMPGTPTNYGYNAPGNYPYGPAPAYNRPLPSRYATMWRFGGRLIWIEIRVVLVFALLAFVLALLLGIFLIFFFLVISGLLVEVISGCLVYFTRYDGASWLVMATIGLMMLFLLECLVFYSLLFVFLTRKVLDIVRYRFTNKLTWKAAFRLIGRNLLRFSWLLVISFGLGFGLVWLSFRVTPLFFTGDNPNWFLGLLSSPVVLLIGANLGFWLLRGFRVLIRLSKRDELQTLTTDSLVMNSQL